jgi:protein SCO1/2
MTDDAPTAGPEPEGAMAAAPTDDITPDEATPDEATATGAKPDAAPSDDVTTDVPTADAPTSEASADGATAASAGTKGATAQSVTTGAGAGKRTVSLRTAAAIVGAAVLLAVGFVVVASGGDDDGDGDGRNAAGSDQDSGGEQSSAADEGWFGALVTNPAQRPDFTLTDTSGDPYDFQQETDGRLTLLFFGYTNCPDVCPIQMATLATALENPDVPAPIVVFVTTDPTRDTPERLRDWLDNFGTEFVGLTGTPEEIRAAEDAALVEPAIATDLQGQPLVEEPAASDDYAVGHAAQIMAYTSDDLTHIVYPAGVQSEAWISDLPRLAEGWPAT